MGGSASVKVQPEPERVNFYRLVKLLMDGGTKVLRDVFDSIHPPATLPLVLNSPQVRRKLKKVRLTQLQWKVLYPSDNHYGRAEDFDVATLVLLLKSICFLAPPETGWNELPTPSDNSTSAEIVRLKCFRNDLYARTSEQRVDDTQFEALWREIEGTLLRMTRAIGKGKEQELRSIIASMLESPVIPAESKGNAASMKEWYSRDLESKVLVDRAVQTDAHDALLPTVRSLHGWRANNADEVPLVLQRQLKKSLQKQLRVLCSDLINESRNSLLALEQKVQDLSTSNETESNLTEIIKTLLKEQTAELSGHLQGFLREREKCGTSVQRDLSGMGLNSQDELMKMIHDEVKTATEWQAAAIKEHIASRLGTAINGTTPYPETSAQGTAAGMSEDRLKPDKTGHDVRPLHVACVEGDMSLLNARLDDGMSTDERDNNQMTPLMAAAAFGQVDAMRLLLSRGANPHLVQDKGWNALHFASTNENAAAAKILLDAGVDIDGETNDGGTALMVAAHCGRINPLRELLVRGANIHLVDEDGWNPLHHACKTDNISIIELLLNAGINIHLQTDDGQSPADIAKSAGFKSVVKFVRSRLGINLSASQMDQQP